MNDEEKISPPSTDDSLQQSEQLNTPSHEEAIASTETSTEAEINPSTLNPVRPGHPGGPQPLNPDMEVHHHTHHDHGKRNWKSYFWEFLMLFLAVFCGFLAEYQLEHKIEKDRERKFITLLSNDLQSDIDSIAAIRIHRIERTEQADSLRTLLNNGTYKEHGADVYYWGRNISRRRFFLSADGTMQQLKNSGGLRLVHNKEIIQKIIAYDVTYRAYLRQLDTEMELITVYRDVAGRVFDGAVFQTISTINIANRPVGNPQLFDASPGAVNELSNRLNYLLGSQYRLSQLLDDLNFKATELLALIKNEYHLK
jgi:hypothetical protein